MPDQDWPPTQRRLARTLGALAYAAAALAGLAVAVFPPRTLELGPGWVHGLGALALVSGSTAALAVARHLWQLEWVAVCQLATAYSVYAVLEWILVARHGLPRAATAVLLVVVASLLWRRAVELWVFSLDAARARTARQALEGAR